MTIVLNEREWAEEMITARSLGKKPFETMYRVARYYLDKGMSKRETRKRLNDFLIKCDQAASLPKWGALIDKALSMALRSGTIIIDGIDVSETEMAKIDGLNGKQIRRLAFTLLCLSKYWNEVAATRAAAAAERSGGKDAEKEKPVSTGWVNSKDNDIMRMANINTSIRRQSLMYHSLSEAGMIRFSNKVDNTNVQVCFADEGTPVLHITDFRNLGYQYMMYHGEPYFQCAECGITEKYDNPGRGRKQKYCRACMTEMIIQRRVGGAMNPGSRGHCGAERAGRKDSGKDGTTARDRMYTVYMHEFPDGKVYVGLTAQNLKDRWKAGRGYTGTAVGDAIEETGWENMRHYILLRSADRESAKFAEAYIIGKKKAYLPEYGYNMRDRSCVVRDDAGGTAEYQITEVDGDGRSVA